MGKRCRYIDEARAVGIFMVVISHLCNAAGLSNPVRDWFNPFMVGLFFMISGYLYRIGGKKRETFSRFFMKKVKSLAIPYVFFSATAGMIQLAAAYERGIPLSAEAKRLAIDFITLKGFGPIWFLPVMFAAELIFYFTGKCVPYGTKELPQNPEENGSSHRLPAADGAFFAVGAALVCLSPFIAPRLFQAENGWRLWVGNYAAVFLKGAAGFATMLMGYYILPVVGRIKKKGALALTGILCLGCTVAVVQIYNMDFNGLDFGRYPILYFIDCILGTVFVIMCCRLADTFLSLELLSYFGKNTLIIMCTHTEWYFVSVVSAGWAQVGGQAAIVGERYYGEMIIKLLFVMALEAGAIELLHKYCPFIPGSRLNG